MAFTTKKHRDRPSRDSSRGLAVETLERRDVPATVPLGMNVAIPEFVDAIKGTYGWGGAPVDARGWPTTDASVVVLDDRVNQPWNGPDPNAVAPDDGGTYHLSFVGRADVVPASGSVQNASYNPATNTTTAEVVEPAGEAFVYLTFSNTQRTPTDPIGTGVTDVRLIRPGYDPGTTQVFTDRYVAALRPFDTLRYMDSTFTNGYGPEWLGRPLEWSQRHLPTDAGVSELPGQVTSSAWEDLIKLANATQTNMWINVPGPATDDYVRQLAALIRDGDTVDGISYPALDPNLKVYVEWSNEVWGGISSTYSYNLGDVQGQVESGNTVLTSDGDPGTGTYVGGPTLLRNEMLHTQRIATAFDSVFHDAAHDRIRPVLPWASWAYGTFPETFTWFQSNFGDPSQYFYGMGGAHYYAASDYSSVDNVLASLSEGEQSVIPLFREYTALANQYGLKNVSYEGGPVLSGSGNEGQVALAASRDPRMEQIVVQGYNDWYANGGDLATFYDGPYGILNPTYTFHAAELSQANNPSASPRYAGLMDVLGSEVVPTPVAPPTLSARAVSSSEIDPSWSPVAGAANYQLQGRLAGTTDWFPDNPTSNQITTSNLTYQNTDLAANTTHEYRVRALDASGNPLTDWSAIASATTRTDQAVAPTLSAGAVSSSQVNLSWTAVAGSDGYQLQGRLAGTTDWFPNNPTSGQITTSNLSFQNLSYQNTGLAANTTYDYRVRAIDGEGNPLTDWSSTVSATTAATTSTVAPPQLSALPASSTANDLSWSAVDGAASYQLQGRWANTTDWYPNNPTSGQITTSGRNYRNTGLSPGSTYDYRVRAIDALGNPLTDWSTIVSATTTVAQAPPQLTATPASPTKIDLSWSPVAGADSYRLQGRLADTTDWYPNNPTSGQIQTGTLDYHNTGLTPGMKYEYRVQALNVDGSPLTDWSAIVAGTTPPATAKAPPRPVATPASPTTIDLSWTAVDGAASYQLEGRRVGRSDWFPNNQSSGQITTVSTTYRNILLSPGKRYEYRVRALDGAGNPLTDWSATVVGTTPTA